MLQKRKKPQKSQQFPCDSKWALNPEIAEAYEASVFVNAVTSTDQLLTRINVWRKNYFEANHAICGARLTRHSRVVHAWFTRSARTVHESCCATTVQRMFNARSTVVEIKKARRTGPRHIAFYVMRH